MTKKFQHFDETQHKLNKFEAIFNFKFGDAESSNSILNDWLKNILIIKYCDREISKL